MFDPLRNNGGSGQNFQSLRGKESGYSAPVSDDSSGEPKIYLLPNLMTAGNLCCGFFAVLTIFKGMQAPDFGEAKDFYEQALLLIFGSCLFDLLDGRLARLGGQESPFGQEFDSLADVVSFGMAPALLVSKAVLFNLDLPRLIPPERIDCAPAAEVP